MTQESNLFERTSWLIRLRWIAILGVILVISFSRYVLKLPLAEFPLYGLVIFLAVYNLIFFYILSWLVKKGSGKLFSAVNGIANIQISLDLLTLTILIHFSGGLENPFSFYFIFHMIIASILLSRRASFLQATLAMALWTGMGISEYTGLLPHYCLKGFIPYTLHHDSTYIFGVSFVFATTIYMAVYMATSISGKLKNREKSLEEANQLLCEKDRIKSEYVLRVTHDIKGHLAAIESCLDPVTEGIPGVLNEEQRDLLTRARDRTWKLIVFIRALLEITRIKLTKQLRMEYFSLLEVIKSVTKDIETRALEKDITFRVNIAPAVEKMQGVSLYVEEAMTNLLANALKYTPPRGEVSLRVSNSQEQISIEVKDTGIGISEHDLPHIFEEFYRADNAKKIEKQGTGLGLAIVKQIVEMHKGEIGVESEVGKGTTFYIRLPKNAIKEN